MRYLVTWKVRRSRVRRVALFADNPHDAAHAARRVASELYGRAFLGVRRFRVTRPGLAVTISLD